MAKKPAEPKPLVEFSIQEAYPRDATPPAPTVVKGRTCWVDLKGNLHISNRETTPNPQYSAYTVQDVVAIFPAGRWLRVTSKAIAPVPVVTAQELLDNVQATGGYA